jgi:cell fate (sporulation/competence/biofilm development) regulator YmcA (YheA/YmcA/DUF963 family)
MFQKAEALIRDNARVQRETEALKARKEEINKELAPFIQLQLS